MLIKSTDGRLYNLSAFWNFEVVPSQPVEGIQTFAVQGNLLPVPATAVDGEVRHPTSARLTEALSHDEAVFALDKIFQAVHGSIDLTKVVRRFPIG